MRRWHVAAMYLAVALGAVGVERRLQCGAGSDVTQQWRVIWTSRSLAVPSMAAQTKEWRRLPEQVIRHRAVRVVTNRTILRHRRMLIRKRSLFFRRGICNTPCSRSALSDCPGFARAASWQSEQTILPSLIGWCDGIEVLA